MIDEELRRRALQVGQYRDPGLTETDKQELRMLASEGRPLYKLLKAVLDGSEDLKEAIAYADLHTEAGLELARQLQRKRMAAMEFTKWFVEQFDDPKRRKE